MPRTSGLLCALVFLTAACRLRPEPGASVPPRPLGATLPTWKAPPDPEVRPPAPPPEPEGPLTLTEALARALRYHPRLRGASWERRAAAARTLDARLYPNPSLELEVEDLGGGAGTGEAETTVRFGQVVEAFARRRARLRLAETGEALAAWDYEAIRLAVLTQTQEAFVGVLAAQEAAALAREARDVAREVHRAVAARVAAGKVSPLEELRARTQLAAAEAELARARRTLEAARRLLAASWGGEKPRFTRAVGQLTVAPPPPWAALARWLGTNPRVARWGAAMARRVAELAAAEAEVWPDLFVQAGLRRRAAPGDFTFVGGLALTLPLWHRNPGRILEARYRVARAREEKRAAGLALTQQLAQAYGALTAAYEEARFLSGGLTAATAALRAAREGYAQGKFRYLDVLDAQRTLFALRRRLVAARATYAQARALVESLVGRSLVALAKKDGGEP